MPDQSEIAAAAERLLSDNQPDRYWEPCYEDGEPEHDTAERDTQIVARGYLAEHAEHAADGDRYGNELDKIAAQLSRVHPIAAVKAIGRMECATAITEIVDRILDGGAAGLAAPCEHKNTRTIREGETGQLGTVVCLDCGFTREWNAY